MTLTFFISYSHTDKAWAKFFSDILEQKGHSVISMDKGLGENFIIGIRDAFDQCDHIILLFSKEYEDSPHCQHEMSVALKTKIEDRRNDVHFVKVKQYEMRNMYSVYLYLDLSNEYPGSAFAKQKIEKAVEVWSGDPAQRPRPNAINNLPPRIPNFTGRKDILRTLHQEFFSNKKEKAIQALVGTGGIGKTQIALEHAYRHLQDYREIWFIHAEDSTVLRRDLSIIAQILQLPEAKETSQDIHIAALKRYFDQHDQYLLIFDNVQSLMAIEEVLPAVPEGHILITSRNPAGWGQLACVARIDPLSIDESVQFFQRRLNTSREDNCFGCVASHLECLPIALTIAASYIDANQICCEDYCGVLRETPDIIITDDMGHTITPLNKVWEVSFARIEKESERSILLLEYLTHFAPDEIPEEILVPVLQEIPELSKCVQNKVAYHKILSLLLQHSLVVKNIPNKTLNMHRLVQFCVRHSMSQGKREQEAKHTVEALSQLFPIKAHDPETIDHEMWQQCQRMLPHAIKTAEIAESMNAAPEVTLKLYAQVASFLREIDNLHQAEVYALRALTIAKKMGDESSCNEAICLETLARIYRDQSRNLEAEQLMLRAIAIEESRRRLPADQPCISGGMQHLAICYDGYGRILSNLKREREAIFFYEMALNLDLGGFGDCHPRIAIRLNNIATEHGRLGEIELEIEELNKALDIEERYYSEKYQQNHPHIAIRLSNLALAYEKMVKEKSDEHGYLDLAEGYWKRAVDINHSFYGPSDHRTLSCIYGYANHLNIRKKYSEALKEINQAVETALDSDPNGYIHGKSLLYRGSIYYGQKKYESSIIDYEKAYDIMIRTRGEMTEECPIILSNLAVAEFYLNHFSEAAKYQQRMLEIRKKNRCDIGKEYGLELAYLGLMLYKDGQNDNAKIYIEQALAEVHKGYGVDSQEFSNIKEWHYLMFMDNINDPKN